MRSGQSTDQRTGSPHETPPILVARLVLAGAGLCVGSGLVAGPCTIRCAAKKGRHGDGFRAYQTEVDKAAMRKVENMQLRKRLKDRGIKP